MLTYGIDWDDVISDLNTHAIQLANGEHGLDLKLEDINSWENVGQGIGYQAVLSGRTHLSNADCDR